MKQTAFVGAEADADESPEPRAVASHRASAEGLRAPFPYFGGKRDVADAVWRRLGTPTQYIEPFCGSAAMLLASPKRASLEVVCDRNGFIANFWRAVKHQPAEVARAADYPVSHIDLGARHVWLMAQREGLGESLLDANWPGDPKIAGWWLWGQCSWIGSGWCDWDRQPRAKKIDHGQIPSLSRPGRGVQAIGQIPHVSNPGSGDMLTSGGRTAWEWLHRLADRLERVRVVHGDWSRCLNHHNGGKRTAVFFDPPYVAYEKLYGVSAPVAQEVAAWCREHEGIRIALCGHAGDYKLPGWHEMRWSRSRSAYGGTKTKHSEMIWFSPPCGDGT